MPDNRTNGRASVSDVALIAIFGLILIGAIFGLHRVAISGLPDPVQKDRGHSTPLLEAVAQRDLKLAQQLLDNGASPDEPGAAASPLVQAITSFDGGQMYCNEPMVKLLLQHGANPNRLDPLTGASPFEAAFIRASKACVEELRAAGASPATLNSGGETILASAVIAAARTRSTEMIDLALSYGVSPCARDTRGWTALHHAVFARSPFVVRALLQRGTDPCILDGNGNTALQYANNSRDSLQLPPEIIDLLTSATVCSTGKPS